MLVTIRHLGVIIVMVLATYLLIILPWMNFSSSPSRQVVIVEKEHGKTDLDKEVCNPTDVEYVPDE